MSIFSTEFHFHASLEKNKLKIILVTCCSGEKLNETFCLNIKQIFVGTKSVKAKKQAMNRKFRIFTANHRLFIFQIARGKHQLIHLSAKKSYNFTRLNCPYYCYTANQLVKTLPVLKVETKTDYNLFGFFRMYFYGSTLPVTTGQITIDSLSKYIAASEKLSRIRSTQRAYYKRVSSSLLLYWVCDAAVVPFLVLIETICIAATETLSTLASPPTDFLFYENPLSFVPLFAFHF